MENLKIGLYDLYGHAVPGCILLFAFIIPFDRDISNFKSLYIIISSFNLVFAIFYILLSYVISHVFQYIAYLWFFHVGNKIWKRDKTLANNEKLVEGNVSNFRTNIRQYSPNNDIIIEEWGAKRIMCYNLSFSFLMLALSLILKTNLAKDCFANEWFILMGFSLLFSILILSKAREYHDWYYIDVYSTVLLIEKKEGITLIERSEQKEVPLTVGKKSNSSL